MSTALRVDRLIALILFSTLAGCGQQPESRPNFLLVMSDDQSWLHTSFAGTPGISTPAFDRLAESGIYFDFAFASAPSCTASRSAVLAGEDFWRLGDAALLWGRFGASLFSYQEALQTQGYAVGYTGKGWGPGATDGRQPAGPGFNGRRLDDVAAGLSSIDYAANFAEFLDRQPAEQPFSFWLTPSEPHRPLVSLDGERELPVDLNVPDFLPDDPVVQRDLQRYYQEIEWQDAALGSAMAELEQRGLLENTVIIVTSDNGMPFPRAKASNYQWGVRVPLVMSWPGTWSPRREAEAVVNLIDLAPTLLELAGIDKPPGMNGRSLLPLIDGKAGDSEFAFTVTGFERHVFDARPNGETYPTRAIHTSRWSLIHNLQPDRWPAGEPPAFRDIDDSSDSKRVMLQRYPELTRLATSRRPEYELFDRDQDPFQINNLVDSPQSAEQFQRLREMLLQYRMANGDPRLQSGGDPFQAATYFGPRPAETRP